VDPWLNGLVYGESVMNDGVAIVLYRAFAAFIAHELTPRSFFAPLGTTGVVLLGCVLGRVAVWFQAGGSEGVKSILKFVRYD
jgi:NhaP-type Na+/H+ or K+/H+ antiporter